MSKTLDDALLESGIVDRHMAQMMERWGVLTTGSADKVDTARVETRDQLRRFAEELVPILGKAEGAYRETRLDLGPPKPFLIVFTGTAISAAQEDAMDRLICDTSFDAPPGRLIVLKKGEEQQSRMVEAVERLYQDDKLVAFQVTVSVPADQG